jgi:hypothetical protein
MQSHLPNMRWGLWTLPVSGFIFTAGYLFNGAVPNAVNGAAVCMTAFGSPNFSLGALINLFGLLLNPFGFIALYLQLTQESRNRTADIGIILLIFSLGMTLTGYGVIAIDLPKLGQLYLQDKASAELGFSIYSNNIFLSIIIIGQLLYLIGSGFFSVVLWQSKNYSKLISISWVMSAFFLCFGPMLPLPALWAGILGAILLSISGGWIALKAKG